MELEVQPNLQSNENQFLSKLEPEYRKSVYILIVIIVVIIGYKILTSHAVQFAMMSSQERYEDTVSSSKPVKEDLIQLSHKKVPMSVYEADYSANSWYAEFHANKVAFDKAYNESVIDIHGAIYKITNEDGCARIVIKGDDEILDYIKFSNCLEGTDRWSDEVANTAVGQEVHIRGIYSGQLSGSYDMVLYKCHIINDK